jgi:NAD-dependent histone deacetylase SIR2
MANPTADPEACTPEESAQYRQMLRTHGPQDFCKMTVEAGEITAKRLLTAFGIHVPEYMQGAEDGAYLTLLQVALNREMHKRTKLPQYNTIDDAVKLMKKSKNIMVLTGAGISTSLGIPDFRSKGTGLYSKLELLGLHVNDPQEVFDIRVFKDEPSIFYSIAKDIIPSTDRFTPTHAFIRLLQDKDKLLTNYSQNIDNIEAKAGIRKEKLIQCHGSFATASCVKCKYQVPGEDIFEEVKAGKIPRCKKCARSLRATTNSKKRKVSKDGTEKKVRRRPGNFDDNSDSEYDMPDLSCGVMKPDITFFGEPLPDRFHDRLTKHDKDKVDLCIVIGTSLKVAPVSEVVSFLPPTVPAIYISRTPVNHINFDIDLLGDCDVVVAELCRRAGWKLDHEMIPKDQQIKTELVEGTKSQHLFTADAQSIVKKETSPAAKEETSLPAKKENSPPTKETKPKQKPSKGPIKSEPTPKSGHSTPRSSRSTTRTRSSTRSREATKSRDSTPHKTETIQTRSSRASTRSREATPAAAKKLVKEDTPGLTASTKKLTVSGTNARDGTPQTKKLSVVNGKLAFT